MDLQLGLMGPQPPRETAQTAYTGARYYRTDSGIYLKDFGRGDSDDSAKMTLLTICFIGLMAVIFSLAR